MAAAPTARADDPYTDILNDVQGSITAGEADYTAAGTDFSTAGDTNEGLIASFAGFDNIFISPTDYTLLGLTAAATGTNFSSSAGDFEITTAGEPVTAAGQEAVASADLALAQTDFSTGTTFFTGGNYFDGTGYFLLAGYEDILASQSDTLAGLFSLGI
jgi:hypothetical protein